MKLCISVPLRKTQNLVLVTLCREIVNRDMKKSTNVYWFQCLWKHKRYQKKFDWKMASGMMRRRRKKVVTLLFVQILNQGRWRCQWLPIAWDNRKHLEPFQAFLQPLLLLVANVFVGRNTWHLNIPQCIRINFGKHKKLGIEWEMVYLL